MSLSFDFPEIAQQSGEREIATDEKCLCIEAGQPEGQGGKALPPMRSSGDEVSLLVCCSLKDPGPVGWKATAPIIIAVTERLPCVRHCVKCLTLVMPFIPFSNWVSWTLLLYFICGENEVTSPRS